MLKALLRVRLASLKTMFAGTSRSKKPMTKGKIIGYALLMAYAFGALGFLFFTYFSQLAAPFYAAGVGWLYFTMFAITAFALMFIGSVFTAKAQLFEAKDNEILLSLPVPSGAILTSRLVLLWLLNLLFDLIAAVPAGVAWCLACPVSAAGVVSFVLIALLLPFPALALSALFGWLISLATRRSRRKSLLSTVFSLVFLALYFVFISRANTLVFSMASRGGQIAAELAPALPLYWAGAAVADGNLLFLLLTALCCCVPFALAWWLLARTFIRTVTTRPGAARVEYREKRQAAVSPRRALLRRESARFFSSSAYVLNGGLGAVFLAAAGVALFFLQGKLRGLTAAAPQFGAYLAPALLLGICMMAGMTLISSASISIEGPNLWIAQVLPVETREVLLAKARLHLAVTAPAALLAGAGAAVAARAGVGMTLLLLLTPVAFTALTDLIGLKANLNHPHLDWTNETQAVKSGVAILIAMAVGWGLVIAVGAGCFLLTPRFLSPEAYFAVVLVLCLGGVALLYRWLCRRGAERFRAL